MLFGEGVFLFALIFIVGSAFCMLTSDFCDVHLRYQRNMDTDFENINLAELTETEVVERMRYCNYEKYKTLVRMHLSFELDLNTDEFDLPCHEIVYEDKGKLRKWNRLSKKQKNTTATTAGCGSTAKSAGNSPTEGLQQQIDAGFMFHLNEIKNFLLLEKNLKQEGIFRKTGSVARQNELRLFIQNEKPLELEASGYSAHDCATVFKSYLSELSEPLLTDAHYPAHLQIAPLCIGMSFNATSTLTRPPNSEKIKREQRLLNSMQLLVLLLPDENRKLLKHVIDILHAVADLEHVNKMSPENLATLFSPHLICPRNLPPEALHYVAKKMSSIIAYMVVKGNEIFEVPAKLSTDIRAYFLDRKRKKTMSPEQTLDDSISDMSTVNTVYTFVDRERTAAAHTTNTTDTELAQLYAHIQSLPESSKKRRLIKQFNKQNGQGTPLQLVIMNRLKNSEATRSAKSFGDSIKKHIFHKGIISRTPKRTSTLPPTGIETPNFSNTKPPKLRVLFQSPAPNSCTDSASATPDLASGQNILTNTPYSLKTHPLQKSISSSSLLLNSSQRNSYHSSNIFENNVEIESSASSSSCSSSTNSTDGLPQQQPPKLGFSASAPVSRQTSRDLPNSCNTLPKSNSSNFSLSTSNVSSQQFEILEPNSCVTPLKLISEAAKQIIGGCGCDKKSVAWDEHKLLEIDEISYSYSPLQSNESYTLLNKSENNEMKSRYKSEPNLSRIMKERPVEIPETVPEQQNTPISKETGKSFTRKLIKGVSMGNLKFPFSTPESTKRLVRSVSSTLKRRHSDDSQRNCTSNNRLLPSGTNHHMMEMPLLEHIHDNLDDLDDETFEDDPNDDIGSDGSEKTDENCDDSNDDETLESTMDANADSRSNSSYDVADGGRVYERVLVQPSGLYRNIDLITSTPALLLGRRSMSPITKSAQRMPKYMQESIMTPRSRKPVMVLTTNLGSSDPNQTIYQTDLSSFREQDEYLSPHTKQPNLHSEDAVSVGSYAELMQGQRTSQNMKNTNNEEKKAVNEALTENFKEYLLTRSVLTSSPPVDSSFSSHPDDFGDDDEDEDDTVDTDSKQEIVNLNESQLSPSLLYCLDGNEPTEQNVSQISNMDSKSNKIECETQDFENNSKETILTPIINVDDCQNSNPCENLNTFIKQNNARKRAATVEFEKFTILSMSSSSSNTETNIRLAKSPNSGNKENECTDEDYQLTKKILISDFPNETSF